MTNKRITYSIHAATALGRRDFRRGDVRWLLAEGLRAPATTRGGEQRWARSGYLGKRQAKLIYLERATEIHIVSIQWVLTKAEQERQNDQD